MSEDIGFLRDLVVVFGCAAPVVYVFHRLKQSPLVGFIVTGVLIGPYALSWIQDVESVHTLATVGVMILLFSLGLEFSLGKLMETRVAVFVTGPLQMLGTVIPVMFIGRYLGASATAAFVYGTIIALSSTAVFMKMLAERAEVDSIHGRIGLGVAIFQDLCAIPLLITIPLLASGDDVLVPIGLAMAKAAGIILAVVLVARYIFPFLLRGILATRSKELFLITSVVMFLGTAWITSMAGISLALGSFLAGLILSESEYGHQIFAEVRPFRDSLNSLFFISIGMLVDPRFIAANPVIVIGASLIIILGKSFIASGAALISRMPLQVAILSGVSLGHIGEFSFILLQSAAAVGLVTSGPYQTILAASLFTMVLSPVFFGASRQLLSRRAWRKTLTSLAGSAGPDAAAESVPFHDHVVICGFGVGGQNIANVLKENGTPYVVLELNAQRVRESRRQGENIFFGDCTSSHILDTVGIRRARVMVVVVSDPFATRLAVRTAREMNPDLVILTRTKYLADIDVLWDHGSTEVIAEEFEASLELLTRILRVYNAPRAMVAAQVKSIRDQRFGVFRGHRGATVPRIRLSSELDIYTETWEVPPNCPWHGSSVAQTRLRGLTGTLILGIIRGSQTFNNPGPDDRILTGDRLVLSGTKEQLRSAMELLKTACLDAEPAETETSA